MDNPMVYLPFIITFIAILSFFLNKYFDCNINYSQIYISPKNNKVSENINDNKMIYVKTGNDYIVAKCLNCNKLGIIGKTHTDKTDLGYIIKGEGKCSCGQEFDFISFESNDSSDKIYQAPSNKGTNTSVSNETNKHNDASTGYLLKGLLLLIAVLAASILYIYFYGGHDLTYHKSNIDSMMSEGQSLSNLVSLLLKIILCLIGLLIGLLSYKFVSKSN